MTIEELREHCISQITEFKRIEKIVPVTPNDYKLYEEHKMVLQLIEAWEGVKQDLFKFAKDSLDEECAMCYHIALYCIEGHLKEVENADSD